MPAQMLEDVLAMPDHLRDALWRVESARIDARESAGLLVCGMGGSAIGGDLAAALLGDRLRGPMSTLRGYEPPSWAGPDWTVLCSSYSGETEETLACFDAAGGVEAHRVVVGTGGELVERARGQGAPVIGLPGILLPRAAVAYMTVAATEVAALAGVASPTRPELEQAATFLEGRLDAMQAQATEVAGRLDGSLAVICGAELTAPVARRWKTQVNENAKLPAFFSELPEADHNEICGWAGAPEGAGLAVVMLEDPERHPRLSRRFDLTAEAIEEAGVEVVRVEAEGESRAERLFSAVMLGDLVSLRLAEGRGVDPRATEALDALKAALGHT
jgi:glucose/mannose-6-phosphate isomerase